MKDFYFKMLTRIRFGVGLSRQTAKLCREYGGTKAFIVADKILADNGLLDNIFAGFDSEGMEFVLYAEEMLEPTVTGINRVTAIMREANCDICVAIGGGSAIDTAKAICILQTNEGSAREYMFGGGKTIKNPGMTLICIPSTAGTGAEVTAAAVIGVEDEQKKLSITDEKMIPGVAILDPEMQATLPPSVTATTGMDALTHAIESYVSLNANPMGEMYSEKCIEMIGANLRTAVSDGSNMEARSNMIIASLIGGAAILNCGLGVVHGIGQAIGGIAHVPHGLINALLLPYCMKRNLVGNLDKFGKIAALLGENVDGITKREAALKSVEAIENLVRDIGIPTKLSQVGVTREMFPRIIEETMAYRLLAINPIKITPKIVEDILNEAY